MNTQVVPTTVLGVLMGQYQFEPSKAETELKARLNATLEEFNHYTRTGLTALANKTREAVNALQEQYDKAVTFYGPRSMIAKKLDNDYGMNLLLYNQQHRLLSQLSKDTGQFEDKSAKSNWIQHDIEKFSKPIPMDVLRQLPDNLPGRAYILEERMLPEIKARPDPILVVKFDMPLTPLFKSAASGFDYYVGLIRWE